MALAVLWIFCLFLHGQSAWFLIAKNHDNMTEWMTAINAQIYQLYTKVFTPPEDNYWSQG